MAVPKLTRSAARERIQKQRSRRALGLILVASIIATVICIFIFNPVFAPVKTDQTKISSSAQILPYSTLTQEVSQVTEVKTATDPPYVDPTVIAILPTQAQVVTYPKDAPILYYSQSGDSLAILAVHFGVEMSEITSTNPIPDEGFIPAGELLLIPSQLEETSSPLKLFPDAEVVNSPSTIDFDIEAFVNEAGGYLSTYQGYLASSGWTSGADIIAKVSREYSVNPRLLLALFEFQSGLVYGQPKNLENQEYAMGYLGDERKGFFNQCAWAAGKISDGYYGWREGRVVALSFPDETVLRMAPDLNSGTVGLMNLFSNLYDLPEWAGLLYGSEGFIAFYETMFGNPWIRAQAYESLFTPQIVQPEMILPFEVGKTWALTGGPHAAWGVADVWAAIDFAPPSDVGGCVESPEWVVASAAGLVVRSENGAVVIDMDGDGFEQTGWNIVYMHIATKDRIPLDSWVETGDRIGHPSCEGGRATGTHVHIARKYNGEWVPADGPLPFVLDGWKARAGSVIYTGWLIKGDKIVRASVASTYISQITREE